MRAVHFAVLGEDIANAAGIFAAQHHAAVAVHHHAIANDQIFRRHIDPASVGVLAGFDRDAIVAGVEDTFFDQHIATAFGITAIVVGPVAVDFDAAHDDVGGELRCDFPHR